MGVAERDSGIEEEFIETGEEAETENETGEETETEEGSEEASEEESEEGDAGDEGEDEDVIQIGDEAPPASEEETAAPKWVKELRRENREKNKRIAELEAKLNGGQPTQQAPKLPEKPTLASCDYDEDKYQAETDAWHAKKREVDAHEASQKAAEEARQKAARAVDEAYEASKKALKVKDYEHYEDAVAAATSDVQQALIKAGASNPALIVAALGKNPKKLAELASIKDPVKFAVALGKLETEVKVTKRSGSNKPAPETTVRKGSGPAPATSATLERLRAEAEKTGDRSKVAAFLRNQRLAGK